MRVEKFFRIAWAGWLLVPACGTLDTQVTAEQMTQARVAVEAAERTDAKTFSPDNLQHAQDALAIAQDAYTNLEIERAFTFFKKATIYARVAKAKTDQKRVEEKLSGAQGQLQALRKQTESAMMALPASGTNTPAAVQMLPVSAGNSPASVAAPVPQAAGSTLAPASRGGVKP